MTAQPITGMPCDTQHPFPQPRFGQGIDSMEYGLPDRRPGSTDMDDIDTAPTWRAIAAWMWSADCLRIHIHEVATDACLTTHLLACATMLNVSPNPIIGLALAQVGAAEPMEALRTGGLKEARKVVSGLPVHQREAMIPELLSIVLRGTTQLTLDINDTSVMRG